MGKASRRHRRGIPHLEHFTQVAAHDLRSVDRSRYDTVVFFGHTREVLCLGIEWTDDDAAIASKTDQLFATRPRYAGMAIGAQWSPDDTTEFQDTWLLVTVERGEAPALLTMNWPAGSPDMYKMDMLHAPWIAASTAGSLRSALDGEPPTFRRGIHPNLFNRVLDQEPPPTHPDGKI